MAGLPVPSKAYFPRIFQDANDPSFVAMTAKMDSIFTGLCSDVRNYRRHQRIEMAPRGIVEAFGHQVSANIFPQDSDAIAVQKAYYATRLYGNRGTWLQDCKIKIDAVAGGNSVLLGPMVVSDAILMGGTPIEQSSSYNFTLGTDVTVAEGYYDTPLDFILSGIDDGTDNAILGSDGVNVYGPDLLGSPYFPSTGDADLGIDLTGSGLEIQLPGNVYIDVDNPFLTADQISQIVISIQKTTCPAYFRVFLCSVDSYGNPIVYSGGIIG